MTALLFVQESDGCASGIIRLGRYFDIASGVCLLLVILYFFSPEWGVKFAGFDSITGEQSFRLGGSVLRVDLAAALGGCVLIFWLFVRPRTFGNYHRLFGILAGGAVLGLAHSRSAIYLVILSIGFSLFSKRSRGVGVIGVLVGLSIAILSIEFLYTFLLRGAEIREIAALGGRVWLWAAVFSENTWVSALLGNGYLMNSPNGLGFYVPEMGRYMDSPHNGYISILLGSGVIGLALVVAMYFRFYRYVIRIKKPENIEIRDSLILVFVFLSALTGMDFGVWGVTSPSMLTFAITYIVVFKIWRSERK